MRVLICGAGRVGHGIARRLAREKHDITIIDENPELVDQVSTDLDVDFHGPGLSVIVNAQVLWREHRAVWLIPRNRPGR